MIKLLVGKIAMFFLGLAALAFSFGGMVIVAYFILLSGRN